MVRKWIRANARGAWREICLIPALLGALGESDLRSIVDDTVTIHRNGSIVARAHRYPLFKRLALGMTRNPLKSIVALLFLYVGAIWLAAMGRLPFLALSETSVRDAGTVNVGVLGVQAALIGLVFPLVIAFVGLLNQGRASFASRLTIYVESTIAVFVGISSLLLCVAIAAQIPFASKMDSSAVAASTILNLAWFATNVLALGYFVLRTIAYMHPARRTPLFQAYVANVVWPRELAETVLQYHWAMAQLEGVLPQGDESPDIFEAGFGARTWYGAHDFGEPRVLQQLWRKKRLVNVRLALLRPVILNWLDRVRGLGATTQHDFVISVDPGHDYDGDQPLAQVTTPLGLVSTFGIWCAFTFRIVPKDHGAVDASADLLRELMADVTALVGARQVDEFSKQLRDVIGFHLFLYELAQSPVEDFNYAVIGPGQGLFAQSETLGPKWAHAYDDLFGRAAERLADEPGFFGRLAHVPATLYRGASLTVTPKALRPLLDMADLLFHHLLTNDLNDLPRAEADSAGRLPRREDTQDRAWREMAAGWERLLQEIAQRRGRSDRSERTWQDFKRMADNATDHLWLTTKVTARAVWRGDLLATRWTCDLLIHWQYQSLRSWGSKSHFWLIQPENLTLSLLSKNWEEVSALPLTPGEQTPSPAAVFGTIMTNASRDHIVTMASLAIHWAVHTGVGATTTTAARMLLRDQPYDRGDIGLRDETPLGSADILVSILRIRGAGSRFLDTSYAGRFDHLLEQLGQLGERPSISWRIYSSVGAGLSFDALPLAHVLTMMATSEIEQSLNGSLRRQLTQRDDDEPLVRRERHLTAMIAALEEIGEPHRAVLAAVAELGTATFEVRLVRTRKLLTEALSVLQEHRAAAIANAPIDPARIADLTAAASGDAFAPTSFPLNFFAAIESTPEQLSPFTLRVQGLSKGSFTNPPMGQTVINEDDWWREAVSRQIAGIVWSDVRNQIEFQDLEGRTPEEFWRAVREGSERMRENGHDPILVLGNSADPEWLRDWRWPHGPDIVAKPEDLVISEAAGQPVGYAFTMNETPVYEAPSIYGEAYLVPTQILERVRYHDYGGHVPLELVFAANPEDPWTGTMSATFQRSVDLAALEGFKIRFASDGTLASSTEGRPVG